MEALRDPARRPHRHHRRRRVPRHVATTSQSAALLSGGHPMRARRALEALADPLIALALAAGYIALLLGTVHNLGYARDEGFYFRAAGEYKKWFDVLFHDPAQAFEQDVVDRYWRTNHEHPGFVKG